MIHLVIGCYQPYLVTLYLMPLKPSSLCRIKRFKNGSPFLD